MSFIQKFSLWIRCSLKIFLSRFMFVNLSIIVNLACSLNLWSFFWKCLSANFALGTFSSLLWLSNLILSGVSFLPSFDKFDKFLNISLYCNNLVEPDYVKGVQKHPLADVLQNRCPKKFCPKHLRLSHFLIKLHTCFPMIFVKFSRTPIFYSPLKIK